MPSDAKQVGDSVRPRIQKKKNAAASSLKTRAPLPVSQEREEDALLECVPGFVWKTDENGFCTYFNRAWLEFRGHTLEEEKGMGWIDAIHPDDLGNVLNIHAEASIHRRPFVRRFRILGVDQQYHWIKDQGSPVFEKDVFKGYCGTAMDMTEDYKKEYELRESRSELEVLLKETNHRIKNNLQILFSLLSLEAQQADDEKIRTFLLDCKNRVHVIVLLHQKLYQNNDQINFADYVRDLAEMVSNTYGNLRSTIDLQMDLRPLSIPVDKVIPCGLIITELLSNSFKHAFPNQKSGKIQIRFHPENDYCVLEVADGGIGLTGNNTSQQTRSLGLKLVSMFVKQLEGDLKIEGDSGTKVTIRFPC